MTWEPAIPLLFGGTPQQLVQYYQVAYVAIHQADAKAMVMGPTVFPVDPAPMQQLWSAGLAKYLDAVSVHPYVKYPPEQHGLISGIRTQMQLATAAKGHSMPFLGTEHGYSSGTLGSYAAGNELRQALADVRSTTTFSARDSRSMSRSTSRTFGRTIRARPIIPSATTGIAPPGSDSARTKSARNPPCSAFAAMSYWLDGTTTIGPLTNLSGTQLGYRFTRGGETILALWDYAANTTMNIPVSAWRRKSLRLDGQLPRRQRRQRRTQPDLWQRTALRHWRWFVKAATDIRLRRRVIDESFLRRESVAS